MVYHYGSLNLRTRDQLQFGKSIVRNYNSFVLKQSALSHARLYFVTSELLSSPWSTSFNSVDQFGVVNSLSQPINKFSSLGGGCDSALLGVGQSNDWVNKSRNSLSYAIRSNKWSPLPAISAYRQYPGALVLPSKRVYVFHGTDSQDHPINTLETMQLGRDEKWSEVKVKKPANLRLNDLLVTQFHGTILLLWRYGKSSLFQYDED